MGLEGITKVGCSLWWRYRRVPPLASTAHSAASQSSMQDLKEFERWRQWLQDPPLRSIFLLTEPPVDTSDEGTLALSQVSRDSTPTLSLPAEEDDRLTMSLVECGEPTVGCEQNQVVELMESPDSLTTTQVMVIEERSNSDRSNAVKQAALRGNENVTSEPAKREREPSIVCTDATPSSIGVSRMEDFAGVFLQQVSGDGMHRCRKCGQLYLSVALAKRHLYDTHLKEFFCPVQSEIAQSGTTSPIAISSVNSAKTIQAENAPSAASIPMICCPEGFSPLSDFDCVVDELDDNLCDTFAVGKSMTPASGSSFEDEDRPGDQADQLEERQRPEPPDHEVLFSIDDAEDDVSDDEANSEGDDTFHAEVVALRESIAKLQQQATKVRRSRSLLPCRVVQDEDDLEDSLRDARSCSENSDTPEEQSKVPRIPGLRLFDSLDAMNAAICADYEALCREKPWKHVFRCPEIPFYVPYSSKDEKYPSNMTLYDMWQDFYDKYDRAMWERSYWAPFPRFSDAYTQRKLRQDAATKSFVKLAYTLVESQGKAWLNRLKNAAPCTGWWYRHTVAKLDIIRKYDDNAYKNHMAKARWTWPLGEKFISRCDALWWHKDLRGPPAKKWKIGEPTNNEVDAKVVEVDAQGT